jgi:hypothetical protein
VLGSDRAGKGRPPRAEQPVSANEEPHPGRPARRRGPVAPRLALALAGALLLPAQAALAFPGLPAALGALLAADAGLPRRASQIRGFTERWLGTPYLWGGTSRGGIDCSAFLRELYRELFGVELPRTTREQIGLGVELRLDPARLSAGLEPGDVIFYVDSLMIPNHVVVYAGRDQIAHSTSGRGVVFDPISKLYGRRVVARRMLIPAAGSERGGAGPRFAAIPPAGPIVPRELPCPPSFRPQRAEVERYARASLELKAPFTARELCDFKVLAEALRRVGGTEALANAEKLDAHVKWVQDIETLEANGF